MFQSLRWKASNCIIYVYKEKHKQKNTPPPKKKTCRYVRSFFADMWARVPLRFLHASFSLEDESKNVQKLLAMYISGRSLEEGTTMNIT